MSPMHIVYACDDYYGEFLATSMVSLFRNHRNHEIHIYILDCGICKETKNKLQYLCNEYKKEISFVLVSEYINRLPLNMGERKISIASYARLFLTSILPKEVDRILYLDCDTLVNGSLDGLWSKDLKDKLVGGVGDTVDLFFKEKLGLSGKEIYINAGVLLIPLATWRLEGLEEKFMETIKIFEGNVPHHDQGVLNLVCANRKLVLPLKYNVTSNIYSFSRSSLLKMYEMKTFYKEKEMEESKINPSIIHFTAGIVGRPWHEKCKHPKKYLYYFNRSLTPWEDRKLEKDNKNLQVKAFEFLYCSVNKKIATSAYLCISKALHYKENRNKKNKKI